MRVWGNRSLGCRPASTQKRAAGFGRQTKVCSPSAAPKGDGAPIAPRPRRSGPRVSGGKRRFARPQPPLKGTALQSPRATPLKRKRGFRAAIKDCQPSAALQGVGAHQSGSLSCLPRKPIGEGQNVAKAACFSANKKADSLKKPFCKRESTPLFSFLSSGLSWKRAGRIRRRPAACGKSSRRQSVSITPG